tara:strand:+ start:211 stop:777 length:567 start_codon:yes stop_codon:yes gene_type:complete
MSVQMQPQVWGDKVFSPVTKAIQAERDRQHQKGIADARNQLDQQRINNQKSYQEGQLQNQKNLLNMIQLPQAKRQEEAYQQQEVDKQALNLDAARKGTHDESMKDYKKAQADVTGKWYVPNSNKGFQKLNPLSWFLTEEDMRNQITAPEYNPQVNMNVSPHINTAIRNSVRVDQSSDYEDLLNQINIP